jgi:Salt stress response/antifungal
MALAYVVVIVLITKVMVVKSDLEYLYNWCNTTNNYTANSMYEANLNRLLSSLSSSISPSGFSTYTVGESPNQAFGLALCRGDVSPNICQDCVNASINNALTLCPYGKAEMIW